jgi:hypothetical protein
MRWPHPILSLETDFDWEPDPDDDTIERRRFPDMLDEAGNVWIGNQLLIAKSGA